MHIKQMKVVIAILRAKDYDKNCKSVADWLDLEIERREARSYIKRKAKELKCHDRDVREKLRAQGLFPGHVR